LYLKPQRAVLSLQHRNTLAYGTASPSETVAPAIQRPHAYAEGGADLGRRHASLKLNDANRNCARRKAWSFSSGSEYDRFVTLSTAKRPDRAPAFFAGIWARWKSVRKECETENDLFAFLTTEPNAVVAPVHPKAMPVILTTREEVEQWLTAPPNDALALQRPLPDDALRIVARGKKEDGVGAA
jgi:SOS response associated peptidase (SRAP)